MDQRVVLPLALALAGAGAVASAAPVGAAIASVHRACAPALRLDMAGLRFTYPQLNGAAWVLLSLAVIGGCSIAVAVRALVRQRTGYRRFLARLEIVGRLRGRPSVRVIADPCPQAFCAGYLWPRVYVSQTAVDLLSAEELEAVLAHEHHHRRLRDPLRFAVGLILSQGLFLVPALQPLFRRYAELAELDADRAAVQARAGGRAALASALLTFEASGAGVSPERVDWLLGLRADWRRPWGLMGASLSSLALLTVFTWGASQVASARATLNLPLLSGRPCLAMVFLMALGGGVAVRRTTPRRGRGLSLTGGTIARPRTATGPARARGGDHGGGLASAGDDGQARHGSAQPEGQAPTRVHDVHDRDAPARRQGTAEPDAKRTFRHLRAHAYARGVPGQASGS
jgi:Zn-dependent protease with chaperone function